jgi:hypothetical protein
MFEIMTNRQKSQNGTLKDKSEPESRENTFKTAFSDIPPSEQL